MGGGLAIKILWHKSNVSLVTSQFINWLGFDSCQAVFAGLLPSSGRTFYSRCQDQKVLLFLF